MDDGRCTDIVYRLSSIVSAFTSDRGSLYRCSSSLAVQVDRFDPRVELDRPFAHLAEYARAALLEATEGRLDRRAGGPLVDLDHARLGPLDEADGLAQVVRDDRG